MLNNKDSLIRNSIVAVACVLGIGGSLWFIRHDLRSSLEELSKKPVGTVYWLTNNAKRLSNRRIQWERLGRNSPIYDGDIVSSDVFSELKINFESGEKLELSANSSVRIIYHDINTIRFVPREGEVQIQTSRKALTVSLAENSTAETVVSDLRINLAPESIVSVKAPEKNAANYFILKVFQGSGTFTVKGVSHTLEAGKALKLGNNGSFQEDLPVVMLAPSNGTRLLLASQGKLPVEFQWKQLNSFEGSITLEISRKSDFSDIYGSWYWETNDSPDLNSTLIDLSEGTHYWKIYTPSSRGDADSGRLDIIPTQGSLALSPANGKIAIPSEKREVRFSWIVPEEAEAVLLEVADNFEMTNPRIRQQIKRTTKGRGSYECSELVAGQWYWRVCPVFTGETGSPSSVNLFILADSTEPSAPKLVNSTPASKPDNVPHLIFPPDNYSLEANRTPDILFTWRHSIPNNTRFQVSELSDFTGTLMIDYGVSGTNMKSPFLAPGIYYWRIAGGDTESTSHPNRLVVLPALPGPLLESPRENERLVAREGDAVKFSWNHVNYASYYQFNLFLEGRETPLREISSLQNNAIHVFFDPNTQGRFTWTIQGFTSPTATSTSRNGLIARGRFYLTPEFPLDGMDQISWTIPRIVNIQAFAGKVDSPITLISPSQGLNISGMQALRSPLEAFWISDVPLRNIQLIVSRTTDPTSDPQSIVLNANDTSVTFPSLSEGIWYWIIRGDTSELLGTTPGNPFWFNVLPIPLLPVPHPIQPESRAVFGLEQLTRERSITFQWNGVEEANAYIFSLYQDDTTPKLLFTAPPQTALTYIFENLSLFNDGNYFWQIEAVYRDIYGVIERRGGTAQHPFTIEVQRSNNLETNPQGTTYGQ